jgi:hypothetical protein
MSKPSLHLEKEDYKAPTKIMKTTECVCLSVLTLGTILYFNIRERISHDSN